MDNGDKIRSMNNEELARYLDELPACYLCAYKDAQLCVSKSCIEGIKEFLEQEVER